MTTKETQKQNATNNSSRQTHRVMAVLITAVLAVVLIGSSANAVEPPYKTLPDPLVTLSGQAVTTPSMWHKTRRPETLQLFTKHLYGRSPEAGTYKTTWKVTATTKVLEGTATQKDVTITVTGPNGSHSFPFTLTVPTGLTTKAPVFLHIDFRARTEMAATTVPRGYAYANFHNQNLSLDHKKYADGIISKFNITGPDAWGALAAWAFGASRVMDYLQTDSDVDAARVAVIGHSRNGKAALWCAAQDTRFAMAVPNNSGHTGVELARRLAGLNNVARVNKKFGHWTCDNYKKYSQKEHLLPVDQHQLVALIAPRLIAMGSALKDRWSDPKAEFYSPVFAQPVFKLLGVGDNIWTVKDFPAAGTIIINGNMQYHLRAGGHALLTNDWHAYMDFADARMTGDKDNLPLPEKRLLRTIEVTDK
jgi:hypothetical protein